MKGLTDTDVAILDFATNSTNDDVFGDYFDPTTCEELELRGLLKTVMLPETDNRYECEGWDITPMGKLLLATYREHNLT